LFVFNGLSTISFRRFRALFVFNDLAPFSFRRATGKLKLWNGADDCEPHLSRSGEVHKVSAISAAPCPRRQSQGLSVKLKYDITISEKQYHQLACLARNCRFS